MRCARAFYRSALKRHVEGLAENLFPGEAEPLRDYPDTYRSRFRDWRLVYRVNSADRVVTIVRVGLKGGPEFCEGLPTPDA
ncbi:MAG: type II toxin-antitoxin system RelE/ParE family toxin [Armatimonadetes bacterium]|nr:type II toxin-antitoxin system RelE/ParE family toxin [Armatimonadota bacterium]